MFKPQMRDMNEDQMKADRIKVKLIISVNAYITHQHHFTRYAMPKHIIQYAQQH